MTPSEEQLDIIGHIQDGPILEIWDMEIHLPSEIFGIPISLTKHVVMLWLAATILIAVLVPLARNRSLVPKGIRNCMEAVLVYIRDEVAIAQIGHKGIYFVPFLATLFFFILTCNLLGLLPFCATATGNISVTAGLALTSFVMIHTSGMRHHGILHYFKALVPPVPSWLFLPMLFIELVGHIAKPFSLAIRLFANMTAGHIVLLVLLSFIFVFKNLFVATASVLGAVAISCLEILVAFIQAFVFTYLTAVFIGTAVSSEH